MIAYLDNVLLDVVDPVDVVDTGLVRAPAEGDDDVDLFGADLSGTAGCRLLAMGVVPCRFCDAGDVTARRTEVPSLSRDVLSRVVATGAAELVDEPKDRRG